MVIPFHHSEVRGSMNRKFDQPAATTDARGRGARPRWASGLWSAARAGGGCEPRRHVQRVRSGLGWLGGTGAARASSSVAEVHRFPSARPVLILFAAFFVCPSGPDDLLGPGIQMLGGHVSQAFFFSIQTFATIGYGQVGPNGLAANLIVTVEALVGMMYQALATGLLFVRFARPRADILFSHRAVIAPYNGGLSLQFRIANLRRNEIIELKPRSSTAPWSRTAAAAPVTALHAAAARAEQGRVLPARLTHRPSD